MSSLKKANDVRPEILKNVSHCSISVAVTCQLYFAMLEQLTAEISSLIQSCFGTSALSPGCPGGVWREAA